MPTPQRSLVLALLVTLCAAGRAQEASGPLAPFARLVGGEWRMTRGDTAIQFDTWTWGPGRHSLVNTTHGQGGEDAPWHVLDVVYWHPGREEVRLFGLHPHIPGIGRGVSEGSLTFDADGAEARVELRQSGAPHSPRTLAGRWVFQGDDRFRETLFEAPAPGAAFSELAAWDYVHATDLTPARPLDASALEVSASLRALAPLLGGPWVSETQDLETNVTWLPLVEVVQARVTAAGEHQLDAYLYHHPTADELRVLALTFDGGVHEGTFAPLADGSLRLALTSHVGERSSAHDVLLEETPDGGRRSRVWRETEEGRLLVLDRTHTRRAPERAR